MVAARTGRAYNTRSKSGGLGDVDWLVNALEPLSKGMAKVLVMDTPAVGRKGQKRDSTTRHQLVALAPGSLYGFKAGSYLVSVIGAGSCVVDPQAPRQVTRLILSGIPANLSNALISGLARINRSNEHGKHTDPSNPSHGRTFRTRFTILDAAGKPVKRRSTKRARAP
jgi:hypothetical protein